MSNKFTSVYIKEVNMRYSFREIISREEAIARYKEHVNQEIEMLTKILNTSDEDFQVSQHTGLYVHRNIKKLN